MNIGRGLGKFAEGLTNGYAFAMKNKREQEMHDAQMQKFKDEQAMKGDLDKLNKSVVKPTESFVVVGADGSQTAYADAAQAHDAASSDPSATVNRKIMVGTKQYDTPEDADAAAASLNSPLAKLRRAAELASTKYLRNDVADGFMKQYEIGKKANQDEAKQAFIDARASGSLDGLAKLYDRVENGQKVKFVENPDGTVTKQLMQGSKVVKETPFKNIDDVWSKAEGLAMNTPDNMLEVWKANVHNTQFDRQQGLAEKRVDKVDIPMATAQIANTEAHTKDIPEAAKDRRTSAAASATSAAAATTSAGAAATQAENSGRQVGVMEAGLSKPTVKEGVDVQGNSAYSVVTNPWDPKTGWGMPVATPVTATGMLPKPSTVNMGAAAMGLNMPGTPGYVPPGAQLTPEQKIEALKKALAPKNPQAGGLNTAPR